MDTGLSLRVRLRGARLDLCDRARVCFGRKGLGYVYKAGRRRAVPGFRVRGPLLELCGTGPEDPAVGRLALSWPEGAPRGAVCLLRAAGTSGASSSERHLLSSCEGFLGHCPEVLKAKVIFPLGEAGEIPVQAPIFPGRPPSHAAAHPLHP